ncbi:hypothetical protein Pd630_LPD07150 [Rhodococcus opacus PD630]|nr:hypothetical protein Pd630_LPD07150 [Rhodococcus opacus PD630]
MSGAASGRTLCHSHALTWDCVRRRQSGQTPDANTYMLLNT